MHNSRTFRPYPDRSNVWHLFQYNAAKVIPFDEMTRTQQRRHQRNYGRMMRQQQEILRPKMSDSPKATNTEGLEDEKEDNVGDSMEELPENSSGRSKFERRKKDENEDDPGQSITIQFGEAEVVQADHRPFIAEANSVERFMYEGNYGLVRVVQEGEETQIVAQSDESFSVDALIEMFDQMRPNIVALEEPVIGKKKIDKC
ncbi:hypothetical protein Adt_42172 [Abeliophyllum distichum]|uniref:Uncharacterized protein n=1 Tax=Abeliophyllum distichum TaxID=126358 RepID=A0ABD1PQX7_9LAMI